MRVVAAFKPLTLRLSYLQTQVTSLSKERDALATKYAQAEEAAAAMQQQDEELK